MNNDPIQQLLQTLQHIAWQLNEINRKLDTLQPSAPQAPADDPKAEAVAWFRAHFTVKEEGDFDRFLDQLPLYPKGYKMGEFLARHCQKGNLDVGDCCTSLCAKHLMALVKFDRNQKVEHLRRSISDNLRAYLDRQEALRQYRGS